MGMDFVWEFFKTDSCMLRLYWLDRWASGFSYEIRSLFRLEFICRRHPVEFLIWCQIQISTEYFHFLVVN